MNHTIYFNAAQNMSQIKDKSVDLVVTSPPYPMIEMWDDIMSNQNQDIRSAFDNNKPREAFELMHQELDKVWNLPSIWMKGESTKSCLPVKC